MKNVGLIIPTCNGGANWLRWLEAFEKQEAKPYHRLIIDSASSDATVDLAKRYGFDVISIKKEDFDHGATRQSGFEELKHDAEIIIFMTQDAILAGTDSLKKIIDPFKDPIVGAVCGRQLPRKNAGAIEAHARLFNYPEKSSVKSIADADNIGIKSVFISNSFAAYRSDALMAVGGFPIKHIFAEDMYVAAKMGLKGYKIAYSSDAKVYHSHSYSYFEEFQRYFDNGVFHAREPWIQEKYGGAGGEGLRYIESEIKYLGSRKPYLIPSSIIRNGLKFIGYKLGKHERYIPVRLKRKFSMNSAFWRKTTGKQRCHILNIKF